MVTLGLLMYGRYSRVILTWFVVIAYTCRATDVVCPILEHVLQICVVTWTGVCVDKVHGITETNQWLTWSPVFYLMPVLYFSYFVMVFFQKAKYFSSFSTRAAPEMHAWKWECTVHSLWSALTPKSKVWRLLVSTTVQSLCVSTTVHHGCPCYW